MVIWLLNFQKNIINNSGDNTSCYFNLLLIWKSQTLFLKKDTDNYIQCARGRRLLTDYGLVNKKLSSQVRDVGILRGIDISIDHYLVLSINKVKGVNPTLVHIKIEKMKKL